MKALEQDLTRRGAGQWAEVVLLQFSAGFLALCSAPWAPVLDSVQGSSSAIHSTGAPQLGSTCGCMPHLNTEMWECATRRERCWCQLSTRYCRCLGRTIWYRCQRSAHFMCPCPAMLASKWTSFRLLQHLSIFWSAVTYIEQLMVPDIIHRHRQRAHTATNTESVGWQVW